MADARRIIRIGLSGWRYPDWRGGFYPEGLRQADELAYAARRFLTLELNGSFYSLQTPTSYEKWARATPDGFVFAVKGSRFITHMKRLGGGVVPMANFFASGVLALGNKLGPVLWQLPATLDFDAARVTEFFRLLPRTTGEAVTLARRHDQRVRGRCRLRAEHDAPIRHAVEVRHPSFDSAPFVDLARRHDVAVVVADTAGRFPAIDVTTSTFTYVRLHGEGTLYAGGYGDDSLARWAARIRKWARKGDVYVYLDNTAAGRAPRDALALAAYLRCGVGGRDRKTSALDHRRPATERGDAL